jgi:hypothetical protein
MGNLFAEDDDTPGRWTGLSEPSRVQILLLPISLVLGSILSKLGFLAMLLWYFVTIPLHETGHAVGAWLGSRIALPIGAFIPMAGFTVMGEKRSFFAGTVIAAGLFALAAWGKRRRSGGLLLFTVLVFAFWVHWTFFVSPTEWQRFSIWAGVGGEFFLSTFLILLGFYDLPERMHWEFLRMPAILYGGLGFGASLGRWIAIQAGRASVPMGSFLSGGSDTNGDMERLIRVHGWTMDHIVRSYLGLGFFCAFLIAAHWIYVLSSKLRTSQR